MQGGVYGAVDNFRFPKYITDSDELPRIGVKPSDILKGMRDYPHGGTDTTLWGQHKFIKNDPRDVSSPQNKIGAMQINHVYPEGTYGETFLNNITSAPKVNPLPTMSTFQPKTYGFY